MSDGDRINTDLLVTIEKHGSVTLEVVNERTALLMQERLTEAVVTEGIRLGLGLDWASLLIESTGLDTSTMSIGYRLHIVGLIGAAGTNRAVGIVQRARKQAEQDAVEEARRKFMESLDPADPQPDDLVMLEQVVGSEKEF